MARHRVRFLVSQDTSDRALSMLARDVASKVREGFQVEVRVPNHDPRASHGSNGIIEKILAFLHELIRRGLLHHADLSQIEFT